MTIYLPRISTQKRECCARVENNGTNCSKRREKKIIDPITENQEEITHLQELIKTYNSLCDVNSSKEIGLGS